MKFNLICDIKWSFNLIFPPPKLLNNCFCSIFPTVLCYYLYPRLSSCMWWGHLIGSDVLFVLVPTPFYFWNKSFSEIESTYYTVYPFKVSNSVVFSKFAELYNHHCHQHCFPPKQNFWPIHSSSPLPQSTQD